MKISLIVPVFNEQEAIPVFYETVRNYQELKEYDVEIVFVNDGSQDKTEELITALAANDDLVRAYSFTRNFGKEAALCCGLDFCNGDFVIPMDVDLQHPISVASDMLKIALDKNADVVLAKRIDRSTDNLLKGITARLFYKFYNKMSNPKIEENVSDFRLMSREVVENIKRLQERNLFMKGLFSWAGSNKTEVIEYVPAERISGTTKFNAWKLWNLALEGITGFSTFPLHVWTYLGGLVAFFAFFYAVWMIVQKLVWGNPVPGYPSLMVVVLFLGGIQLIGIGVLGEYIGRIYIETKERPRYILKK